MGAVSHDGDTEVSDVIRTMGSALSADANKKSERVIPFKTMVQLGKESRALFKQKEYESHGIGRVDAIRRQGKEEQLVIQDEIDYQEELEDLEADARNARNLATLSIAVAKLKHEFPGKCFGNIILNSIWARDNKLPEEAYENLFLISKPIQTAPEAVTKLTKL